MLQAALVGAKWDALLPSGAGAGYGVYGTNGSSSLVKLRPNPCTCDGWQSPSVGLVTSCGEQEG